MTKHTLLFSLAAAMVAGGIGACSSSNNNSTGTGKDAGSTSKDAGDASSNGNDAGSTNQEDASTNNNQDAGATNDAEADAATDNEDASDPAICTVPATPPSGGLGGSCTGLITGDAGSKELDAGFDDAGNASRTTCNPVTNDGCTGTDICSVDYSGNYYACFPSTGDTVVNLCGNCTAATTVCAVGALCIDVTNTTAQCWQFCCIDADCGGAFGSCDTQALGSPLPNGLGLCVQR